MSFIETIKEEFLETLKLYLEIIKKPYLILVGIFYVLKDLFYEFPKSFFVKKSASLKVALDRKASQALAISEAATIPGTFTGVALFKSFGADDYSASVIGGAVGNYIFGAVSCWLSFILLTRTEEEYHIGSAMVDAYKVIRDCFPAVLALYVTDAPILSLMIFLGIERNIAVGLNLALGLAVFTGIAKHSASSRINIKEQKKIIDK